jgi:hypothetical protein
MKINMRQPTWVDAYPVEGGWVGNSWRDPYCVRGHVRIVTRVVEIDPVEHMYDITSPIGLRVAWEYFFKS